MQHHALDLAAFPPPPAYLEMIGEIPLLDMEFDAFDDLDVVTMAAIPVEH